MPSFSLSPKKSKHRSVLFGFNEQTHTRHSNTLIITPVSSFITKKKKNKNKIKGV